MTAFYIFLSGYNKGAAFKMQHPAFIKYYCSQLLQPQPQSQSLLRRFVLFPQNRQKMIIKINMLLQLSPPKNPQLLPIRPLFPQPLPQPFPQHEAKIKRSIIHIIPLSNPPQLLPQNPILKASLIE